MKLASLACACCVVAASGIVAGCGSGNHPGEVAQPDQIALADVPAASERASSPIHDSEGTTIGTAPMASGEMANGYGSGLTEEHQAEIVAAISDILASHGIGVFAKIPPAATDRLSLTLYVGESMHRTETAIRTLITQDQVTRHAPPATAIDDWHRYIGLTISQEALPDKGSPLPD